METESPIYLRSPLAFHFEMPLYDEIDIGDEDILDAVIDHLSYRHKIDLVCVFCGGHSIFSPLQFWNHSDTYKIARYWRDHPGSPNVLLNTFECGRNSQHIYYVQYVFHAKRFQKIGQYPSVADLQLPQIEKYRSLLRDEYREFSKAIRLFANGIGAGSLVYLRRIFENLINEAKDQAINSSNGFSIEKYEDSDMGEKVKILKDYLPGFLVENKHIYGIMSKGIHELTEKECLDYFPVLQNSIEIILDEKIARKEKEDREAKAAAALNKINMQIKRT